MPKAVIEIREIVSLEIATEGYEKLQDEKNFLRYITFRASH